MKPTSLSVSPQAFADKNKPRSGYFLVLTDSEDVCSRLLLLPGFWEEQCILSFYAGLKVCAALRQLASSL